MFQVTHSKNYLEKGLRLSKKLKKEMTVLRDFIAVTERELTAREVVLTPQDTDEDLQWIRVSVPPEGTANIGPHQIARVISNIGARQIARVQGNKHRSPSDSQGTR